MTTPIIPNQSFWNTRKDPSPHVTTSGFAVDPNGYFPIFYRGENVRSAKNCWALPSGLHECGFTLADQFAIELKEELNLDADATRAKIVGVYENITALDSWHWVIVSLVIPIVTVDALINREPDKHTDVRLIHYSQIGSEEFLGLNWAPSLGKFLKDNEGAIHRTIINLR